MDPKHYRGRHRDDTAEGRIRAQNREGIFTPLWGPVYAPRHAKADQPGHVHAEALR